jgi:hypothetical protein
MYRYLSALCLVLTLAACGQDDERPAARETSEAEAEPGIEAEAESTPAPQAVPLNTPTTYTSTYGGQFTITADTIDCGVTVIGNPEIAPPATSKAGKFCRLRLTVVNSGTVPAEFTGRNSQLRDKQGRWFNADRMTGVDQAFADGIRNYTLELNPAESRKVTIVFDVPADSVAAFVDVRDQVNDEGVMFQVV